MISFNNLISIGPNCCIRLMINIFCQKNNLNIGKTNFFDYILTDFNTINYFLNDIKIKDVFKKENLIVKKNENNNYHIDLKNVYFKSIHDVKKDSEIDDFLVKYIKRYELLIYKLKNQNNVLIFYGDIDEKDYLNFYNNLNNLSHRKQLLICISSYQNDKLTKVNDLFYKINYNQFLNHENKELIEFIKNTKWIMIEYINWELIFAKINELYKSIFTLPK